MPKINKFTYKDNQYVIRNDFPNYLLHYCTGVNVINKYSPKSIVTEENKIIKCLNCRHPGFWHGCYLINIKYESYNIINVKKDLEKLHCPWCDFIVPDILSFPYMPYINKYNPEANICFKCNLGLK